MQRVKDYSRLVAWQTGITYLLIWAVALWTLDQGVQVFGSSGVCYPDQAKVLFYWVCEATSPLAILSTIANAALTVTVWAPVYVAAATVQPDAAVLAGPIIALHAVGLPLGILVVLRMLVSALDARRLPLTPRADLVAACPAVAGGATQRRMAISPRREFGLRGVKQPSSGES